MSSLVRSSGVVSETTPLYPVPTPTHQRRRAQWSPREDVGLLRTVLGHARLLLPGADPAELARARKLFWHHVRAALQETQHVAMNRRQCRDRFRLLYQRSQTRAQYREFLPPASRAEELGDQCVRVFRFNEHRELAIADSNALTEPALKPVVFESSPLQPYYGGSNPTPPSSASSCTVTSCDLQAVRTAIVGLQHQLSQLTQELDALAQTVDQVATHSLEESAPEHAADHQYVTGHPGDNTGYAGVTSWPPNFSAFQNYEASPTYDSQMFRHPQYAEN
ncbi:uncharacterized protein LALA0_S15e00540g [Lachancea lanzarotensis]|uniref:LALA0S15e00540g1_1 n=1 Tax=Lachancea lanzarotensis TaxID=1245769 RepID=A0A0C7NF17_9SACH|nr:uncharacterized protein LALA0_S15e00540g [Lachancea lanzarotensis]CEP64927.1 LALA0S15e00540g1_1 [Lachancea lanzarotensis]